MAELWNEYESIPTHMKTGVNVRTRLVRALQETEWMHDGEVIVQMRIRNPRGHERFGLTTAFSKYNGGIVPEWIMQNHGDYVVQRITSKGAVAEKDQAKVEVVTQHFEDPSGVGMVIWTGDIPDEITIEDDGD